MLTQGQQVEIYYICVEQSKNADSDANLGSSSAGLPSKSEILFIVTPHAQLERGKVIGLGVLIYIYIYICLWETIFESYFSDRLTFSNIRGRTSRRIYRLVLALLSLETLSSLSK